MDDFEKAKDKGCDEYFKRDTHPLDKEDPVCCWHEGARWAREWCNLESSKITALEKATENISKMLNKKEAENQRLREALKDIAVNLVVKEDNYMALHMREVAKQALAGEAE